MTRPIEMVSGLPAADPMSDDDLLMITQDGDSKKATIADFVSKARIPQGLLSARPAAASVADGAAYFATDTNGGTLYVEVSDAWVTVASADNASTGVLASANPTTAAALTISAAYTRIPEFTTPSFTMPDATCTIAFGQFKVSNVSVAGLNLQVRWTDDAWATSNIAGGWTELAFASNTSTFGGAIVRLGTLLSLATPTPGDTIQVGMFLNHPSDTSVTPAALHAFSVVTLLEVRAG